MNINLSDVMAIAKPTSTMSCVSVIILYCNIGKVVCHLYLGKKVDQTFSDHSADQVISYEKVR